MRIAPQHQLTRTATSVLKLAREGRGRNNFERARGELQTLPPLHVAAVFRNGLGRKRHQRVGDIGGDLLAGVGRTDVEAALDRLVRYSLVATIFR